MSSHKIKTGKGYIDFVAIQKSRRIMERDWKSEYYNIYCIIYYMLYRIL